MMFASSAFFLCLICLCLAAPHHNVARGTTSLIRTSSLSVPSPTPTSAPEADQNIHSKHVNDFYKLYGWLKPGTSIPDKNLTMAIRKIQRKLKEPVTGIFSNKMMKMMSGPRCGTEQPYNSAEAEGHQYLNGRYVLWGPKWAKSTLTWRFENYSSDMTTTRQQATISAAFSRWMDFIPLNIVQAASNTKADINFRFMPFGKGDTRYGYTTMLSDGVYMSSGNINITFNDDYQWTDDRLFSFTAVHEIGHALGLSHSTVEPAIMFAYYDGTLRPMHPDDKMGIHSAYGWKSPKWNRIDSGSKITNILQVTSNSATPATDDGLYQMRSTGQILRYTNGAWATVDNNKDTVQITGAYGRLYQLHYDGATFRLIGSASNWQAITNTDANVVDIVAAADQLYSRRKDGTVARQSGLSWIIIDQPSTLASKQIVVTDDKTLWNLLSNGYLVRTLWPYSGDSWVIVDDNSANVAVAVGGNEFYKLQSDGAVVWLDNAGPYWSIIEQANSVGIYAVGGLVYSRHGDGTIWRWTGTQGVWEMIDERGGAIGMVGDRMGSVWELTGSGEVWALVS